MRKWSWTRTILVCAFLSIVAAPPLLATEEPQLQQTARVGRGVAAPHAPSSREPIRTPTGDDDNPDGTVRPPHGPPIANGMATSEHSRAGWWLSMWTRLQELREIQWRFGPRY